MNIWRNMTFLWAVFTPYSRLFLYLTFISCPLRSMCLPLCLCQMRLVHSWIHLFGRCRSRKSWWKMWVDFQYVEKERKGYFQNIGQGDRGVLQIGKEGEDACNLILLVYYRLFTSYLRIVGYGHNLVNFQFIFLKKWAMISPCSNKTTSQFFFSFF